MRFMVIVKASRDSEAGVMPSEQLLTEMGTYNEELTKAGILLAGDGLHPSFEAEDFGPALTPEIRKQEERIRARVAGKK